MFNNLIFIFSILFKYIYELFILCNNGFYLC